jgi:lipoate-protein ligase A
MESRLILDPPAIGSWNMAVDEVLLERAAEGAGPCLRFYAWSEPTLSLGYFQPMGQRIDHEESRAVPIVRRGTGGGAILHDHEITYSWTCPDNDRSTETSRQLYLAFHETARELLRSHGIEAELFVPETLTASPSGQQEPFLCFQRRADGDLVVGEHKILGSAQRRQRGALLQHGSFLLKTSCRAPQLVGLENLSGLALDSLQWIAAWCRALTDRLGMGFSLSELDTKEHWRAGLLEAEKFRAERWTAKR